MFYEGDFICVMCVYKLNVFGFVKNNKGFLNESVFLFDYDGEVIVFLRWDVDIFFV